jgi:hypothetical protein
MPFNSPFYATAATVIPVLFLAIVVPGRHLPRPNRRRRERRLPPPRSYRASLAGAIAALILTYGTAGEIAAILALQNQQGATAESSLAGGAVILLTIVTVAGPARAFLN